MNITDYNPAPRRIGRRRRQDALSSPTPVPPALLTLIAASYVDGVSLRLEFNQAIDISAFNGEAVFVNDPAVTGNVYIAGGAVTLLDATTMRVGLVEFDPASGSGVTLTAPATTEIVAINGGGTWSGVSNLNLPFP